MPRCPECEQLRHDAYAVQDRERLIILAMHYGPKGAITWRQYGCSYCGATFQVRLAVSGQEAWLCEMADPLG